MTDPAKYYADAQLGVQTRNPMDQYVPPPKGRSLFTYGRAEEETSSFAWWPIILAVMVALAFASCGQLRPEKPCPVLVAQVPTFSLTLYAATGDTLYHCPTAFDVYRGENGVRFKCDSTDQEYHFVNGTISITPN